MESAREREKENIMKAAMVSRQESGPGREQTGLQASEAQNPMTIPIPGNSSIEQDMVQAPQESTHGKGEEVNISNDGEDASPNLGEDALKTPRGQDSTTAQKNPGSIESAIVKTTGEPRGPTVPARMSALEPGDYFPPARPSTSDGSDFTKNPFTSGASSNIGNPLFPDAPGSISSPPTSGQHGQLSRDVATENPIGPFHSPESTRPISVPNLQTASLQRRRDGQDYPQYPNQSFSALQKNPPYPHPLRTRTSNPLHSLSYSSTNPNSATALPHLPSGAKTVGNTPAQSPGLFSPTSSKRSTTESEDGGYHTPMLHPTHLQAPKETHNLQKGIDPISGRKTINQYELFHRLGSGQHGTVKLGRNMDNGEQVAVKIVRRFSKKLRLGRSGDPNDMIKKEVAILKKARHPHVVSLYEVIDDEEFAKVYLVLEFVERGEIIWRKPADKSIAMAEKERLEREISGTYDEAFERAVIEQYNAEVPMRREEKARLLEEQKREALKQLETQRHTHKISSGLDASYWSLEYGGDSENDLLTEPSLQHSDSGRESRLSRADIHAAETASHPQGSPHTPRSHPYPTNLEHLSSSQPGSRPDSPSIIDFGGFSDEGKISDLDLQATLSQIIANQTQWTEDEEDYRHVPCLTLDQALDAFRDTVLGLEYLHFQGIMHRDIKPANLLWTSDYRVKISDFGVSYLGKPIREDTNKEELPEADTGILDESVELAKTVGTPAFYAPELCDPDQYDTAKSSERPAITGQIDVWALGVTLYGMIFGRLPFFDSNEFRMYEKIARDPVFIPRMRLRGVVHTDKTPSDHNKKEDDQKREDDVLAYEEVEDTLHDLIKRLLAKNPSQRISLKEVKHHPWVIGGIENREAWLDETDPSVQSQGKKIEPSNEEVADAVVGLTVIDRIKIGVQRLSSLARGRGSRKRTDSNPKPLESSGTASTSKAKDERRSSLGGNEALFTALKASRDPSEHHPLSQSVAASPEAKQGSQYFSDDFSSSGTATAPPIPSPRPSIVDRSLSTADSMKTIRPIVATSSRDATSAPSTSARNEEFSNTTPFVEPSTSTSSSISDIFKAPGRFMTTMRSRERGAGRSSPSQSSRASSADPATREDLHAQPSLALSSAFTTGHVDQPPALREDADSHPPQSSNASSTDAFAVQEQNRRRQTLDQNSPGHRRSMSQAAGISSPPSTDDFLYMGQQRPASAAESTSNFPVAISSSSDMIVSGESAAHSRIPSVVSGASSISATQEDDFHHPHLSLEKSISPFTVPERSASSIAASTMTSIPGVPTIDPTPAQAKADVEAEAGYNGEPEEESDSEDEGLAMA